MPQIRVTLRRGRERETRNLVSTTSPNMWRGSEGNRDINSTAYFDALRLRRAGRWGYIVLRWWRRGEERKERSEKEKRRGERTEVKPLEVVLLSFPLESFSIVSIEGWNKAVIPALQSRSLSTSNCLQSSEKWSRRNYAFCSGKLNDSHASSRCQAFISS